MSSPPVPYSLQIRDPANMPLRFHHFPPRAHWEDLDFRTWLSSILVCLVCRSSWTPLRKDEKNGTTVRPISNTPVTGTNGAVLVRISVVKRHHDHPLLCFFSFWSAELLFPS